MSAEENPLRHVLEGRCEDEGCPLHRPLQAEPTAREMAFFLAGAQEAVERFIYWSDEDLGVATGTEYPTRRLGGIVLSLAIEIRAKELEDGRIYGPELREEDLKVEPWGQGTPLMRGAQGNPRGVRITHLPTGEVGEYDKEKSQLKNRAGALAELREKLRPEPGKKGGK